MAAPNEITVSQLLRRVGLPDAPCIVDVCLPEDVADEPFLIPGSFHHPHTDIPGMLTRMEGRPTVVVCQKGKKLSQGVAALLRSEGAQAEYLQGGMFAWRDHPDAPRIPMAQLPPIPEAGSLWVTRHRPKIDRIACPWFIRRFVDAKARFLFVSPKEVLDVAGRFDAIPFDIEGVHWSHRDDRCTFDTLLDELGCHTPALDRLAQVIRAADTNRHDLAPQAAGLLALSVGLSRQYKDDLAQLEAGLPLYDALYRWARDGTDEGHDWPGNSA